MILRLPGEELPHSEVQKMMLIVVSSLFVFLLDVFDEFGVLGKRIFEHDIPLEQKVETMRDVLFVCIDDFSAAVGDLLDLIDQLLIDFKEIVGIPRYLPKKKHFFEKLLSVVEEKFFPKFFGQVVVDQFFDIVLFFQQVIEVHFV